MLNDLQGFPGQGDRPEQARLAAGFVQRMDFILRRIEDAADLVQALTLWQKVVSEGVAAPLDTLDEFLKKWDAK